ncbi:MAG: hypothetical protein IKM94_04400, partial [Alphaproteobacteria bacterium]|nr:hypothetical protein [Alphaproteobacteria bacterium]
AGKKCLLVEDNDGTPHWYEIIENAYGLPSGYTALEYIENTDSQYINTGITVNSGTTVIATFQGTDDDRGAVFGYDQDYTGTMMQCYNGKWRVNNTTTDLPCTTKATVDITWTDDTSGRHVSTATINGITVPTYTNSRTYRTLMLFQGNGWDNANNYWTGGKIYSLNITQNNTLVRNFVPARNSSGVIGMYDTVSGRFFTNAGTGTFVDGPEI